MTCYVEFRENLLVLPDIFCNFLGLILCNAKLPWFQWLKNNKVRAHFMKYYIPLHIDFLLKVLLPMFESSQNCCPLWRPSFSLSLFYQWKPIIAQFSSFLRVFFSIISGATNFYFWCDIRCWFIHLHNFENLSLFIIRPKF